ncbi:MAG TPA: membrane dipeptidase [Gaiellaceae bacterium]
MTTTDLASSPIVDAHSDLLIELAFFHEESNPFASRWLPKLDAGGVRIQVCALFAEGESLPELALRQVMTQVAAFNRAVRENADCVVSVASAGDLGVASAPGKVGLMLSMEGAEPLGYDPDLLDLFCDLGVRMISLTWNRRNPFADGTTEDPRGGLSQLGRRLVDRISSLPLVLDLAHANAGTFFEALERSGDAPVVVSHALCRALCDTPRNLSDDQLRALAERDGVLGLMALPLVVHPTEWTIPRIVDHVDHLVETIGIQHVGLGGDFTRQISRSGAIRTAGLGSPPAAPGASAAVASLEAAIEGLAGPEDYGNLVEGLRARGYGAGDLNALCGGNLLRVLARALPV